MTGAPGGSRRGRNRVGLRAGISAGSAATLFVLGAGSANAIDPSTQPWQVPAQLAELCTQPDPFIAAEEAGAVSPTDEAALRIACRDWIIQHSRVVGAAPPDEALEPSVFPAPTSSAPAQPSQAAGPDTLEGQSQANSTDIAEVPTEGHGNGTPQHNPPSSVEILDPYPPAPPSAVGSSAPGAVPARGPVPVALPGEAFDFSLSPLVMAGLFVPVDLTGAWSAPEANPPNESASAAGAADLAAAGSASPLPIDESRFPIALVIAAGVSSAVCIGIIRRCLLAPPIRIADH